MASAGPTAARSVGRADALGGAAAFLSRTARARPRLAAPRAGRPQQWDAAEDAAEDAFDTLGVTPADSGEVVREAYRRLQKQCHPDIAGTSAEAVARSAALNAAYETLSDQSKRAAYVQRTAGVKGARRGPARAAPRREGLVGPLRQERLLATLVPRRAPGTPQLTGEELRDCIREWAKTLAFGCELPLPLPLQVDDLPEGVRMAMLRLAPGGGLSAVGELVFSVSETDECDVDAAAACDWRASVLRRWPASEDEAGPLPGEERILDALRSEFAHLLAVGTASPARSFELPGWLSAFGSWILPALPIMGSDAAGGDYRGYHLQRSCRLSDRPVDFGSVGR